MPSRHARPTLSATMTPIRGPPPPLARATSAARRRSAEASGSSGRSNRWSSSSSCSTFDMSAPAFARTIPWRVLDDEHPGGRAHHLDGFPENGPRPPAGPSPFGPRARLPSATGRRPRSARSALPPWTRSSARPPARPRPGATRGRARPRPRQARPDRRRGGPGGTRQAPGSAAPEGVMPRGGPRRPKRAVPAARRPSRPARPSRTAKASGPGAWLSPNAAAKEAGHSSERPVIRIPVPVTLWRWLSQMSTEVIASAATEVGETAGLDPPGGRPSAARRTTTSRACGSSPADEHVAVHRMAELREMNRAHVLKRGHHARAPPRADPGSRGRRRSSGGSWTRLTRGGTRGTVTSMTILP